LPVSSWSWRADSRAIWPAFAWGRAAAFGADALLRGVLELSEEESDPCPEAFLAGARFLGAAFFVDEDDFLPPSPLSEVVLRVLLVVTPAPS
jgi:hypothetical protein